MKQALIILGIALPLMLMGMEYTEIISDDDCHQAQKTLCALIVSLRADKRIKCGNMPMNQDQAWGIAASMVSALAGIEEHRGFDEHGVSDKIISLPPEPLYRLQEALGRALPTRPSGSKKKRRKPKKVRKNTVTSQSVGDLFARPRREHSCSEEES